METKEFSKNRNGELRKAAGGYWTFIPKALPEQFEYSSAVGALLSIADRKVGKLQGLCYRLPNPHLLSGAYLVSEAVVSSRIEGTESSESDLFLSEIDEPSVSSQADVQEVGNYVRALDYGIKRRSELPLSLRLIREMHGILMQGVRGKSKSPGEFRTSQNWIGGARPDTARYVPPPADEMKDSLDALEKFLHRGAPERIPALIECALLHYQFEAIHPFLDGNGRLGRLLIILLCIERDALPYPLLYLSAYFNNHRDEYLDLLFEVSRSGDWESWLSFFLRGAAEQAEDSMQRALRVLDLHAEFTKLDVSPTAKQLLDLLFSNPYTTLKSCARRLNVTPAAASRAVSQLEAAGVLSPLHPDRKRGQVYRAERVLTAFEGQKDQQPSE